MSRQPQGGPMVAGHRVVFRLPDPGRELRGIRLYQEMSRPRLGPAFDFDRSGGLWTLDLERPPAARMEYLLELQREDGSKELVPDPHNPRRAPGPFGDKSEVTFDGYRTPVWTEESAPPGRMRTLEVPCRAFRARLPVLLWSSPGIDDDHELPLLIVNDGPEFAEYSLLIRFLEVMTEVGRVPKLRAALIAPVDRDHSYSASAAYTRSFAHEILPRVLQAAPTPHGRSMRMGMGASLGALAMLHAHRREPATLGALLLMSGSYFRKRFDPQESGFVRFRRISRFVGEVLTAETWAHPVPVAMTCGSAEENLRNNRAITHALASQGYDVGFHENSDAHNWIAWRDVLDPHVADFLGEMWG